MFTLPPLPFAEAALEPHISARTMKLHHGAHHKAYVDKLNALVADTPLEELTLEEIIHTTQGSTDDDRKKIFNNAGQHWNHSFFWNSLSSAGGAKSLTGELAAEGRTMLIVTHEIAFARDIADRVLFLDGGTIVEAGPAREVITAPREARTQAFFAKIRH